MRVAQVVADGRPGGGTSLVLDLLEGCRERGWDTLLVTQEGSYAAGRAQASGATVCPLELFRAPDFASSRRAIDGWLRAQSPDVVHVHGNRAAFFVGPLVDRHPEVRFHYTVHGYHFEHRAPARRLLGRWLERRASTRLRSRVFVCAYDLELARRRRLMSGDSTARVIYNGVDAARLEPFRSEQREGVVWLGRLVPQKDPELVAEIAVGASRRGVPVRIVGGGEGEQALTRRLEAAGAGECRVTGALSREGALAELGRARLMILPSRWEGLPLVMLEAMSLDVPVMAAPVGGVPEVIEDEVTGWLIGSRRAGSWVRAIEEVLEDEEARARVAARAHQRFEERFSWASCWQGYVQLWTRGETTDST